MRTDRIMLHPIGTMVADARNVGTWLFNRHMPGHFNAGMRTLYTVLPR
jgi:hypothetical protein